jgi:hypothetical protein
MKETLIDHKCGARGLHSVWPICDIKVINYEGVQQGEVVVPQISGVPEPLKQDLLNPDDITRTVQLFLDNVVLKRLKSTRYINTQVWERSIPTKHSYIKDNSSSTRYEVT